MRLERAQTWTCLENRLILCLARAWMKPPAPTAHRRHPGGPRGCCLFVADWLKVWSLGQWQGHPGPRAATPSHREAHAAPLSDSSLPGAGRRPQRWGHRRRGRGPAQPVLWRPRGGRFPSPFDDLARPFPGSPLSEGPPCPLGTKRRACGDGRPADTCWAARPPPRAPLPGRPSAPQASPAIFSPVETVKVKVNHTSLRCFTLRPEVLFVFRHPGRISEFQGLNAGRVSAFLPNRV